MSDPFKSTTKQEIQILNEAKERTNTKARTFKSAKKKEEQQTKVPVRVSELYNAGIKLLENRGFVVELDETGDHVNHRILKPSEPPEVQGVRYPHAFNPLQDISEHDDFEGLEAAFHPDICEEGVREFWTPLFRPKAGDSDLTSFTERLLKMKRVNQTKNIHQTLEYGHTFDVGEPRLKRLGVGQLQCRQFVCDAVLQNSGNRNVGVYRARRHRVGFG